MSALNCSDYLFNCAQTLIVLEVGHFLQAVQNIVHILIDLFKLVVNNGNTLQGRVSHIPLDVAEKRRHLVKDLAQRLKLIRRILENSAHDYVQEFFTRLRRPVLYLIQQTVKNEDRILHVLDSQQKHRVE